MANLSTAMVVNNRPLGWLQAATMASADWSDAIAQALYQSDEGLDGLVWRSGQFDDALAIVLWATRDRPGDLDVVDDRTLIRVGSTFCDAQLPLARAKIVITP